MFVAALFTIVKIWKQLKCLSTDEWVKIVYKKCVYIYIYTHTYKNNKNCVYRIVYIYIHIHTHTHIDIHIQ